MSRIWAQVSARGDVTPISTGTTLAAGSRDGFRIRTTATQSVASGGAIAWHSDSAITCFNVGAFWDITAPTVAVLPAATDPVEWYIFSLQIRMLPESFFALSLDSPAWIDYEGGKFNPGTILTVHSSGMFFVRDTHTLAQRTFKVTMGTEYTPPFDVENFSTWSIMRVR